MELLKFQLIFVAVVLVPLLTMYWWVGRDKQHKRHTHKRR